jgi:ATP-binding cassette subfamily F protein 3
VIERGDRIALVGVNGAGKSTLIKLLGGQEQATEGEVRLGHNVEVDYFAQDQYKALDPQARLLDDLFEVAPRATQTELRSLLGCFLFSEDDVFKTVGVLSGGERNRYALARMLLHPSNFLLLDEPTNHLDMRAKDVLLESMQKFTGTVVFVSHDRYFIDKLATRVFEIGEGEVVVFPGSYEDYLWRKHAGSGDGAMPAASESNGRPRMEIVSEPELPQSASSGAKQKRINPIKLKQMQDRLQEVEEEVARLETEIAQAETALQVFVSVEESQRQTEMLDRAKSELSQRMAEWEELAGVLGS